MYLAELPLALTAAVAGGAGYLYYHSESGAHDVTSGALYLLGAALSTGLWKYFWRLYHYIADTPTSRIATASQGLVELQGAGELLPGKLSQGISMGPPALWQSYTITEGDKVVDTGRSSEPFVVRDKSGTCVIYPDKATVISSSKAYPRQGRRSANISFLCPGDAIYVLGELRSVGGDNDHYDLDAETSRLLKMWKRDQKNLVASFDRDGDGRIDGDEWQAVRVKARRVAQENIRRSRSERQVVHEIRKPASGLPLIISDKDPAYLERRYHWLGIANLTLAFCCFILGAINIS